NDNFFALGGDSILSLQIISRANQAGLYLTPKQLFQHQTIAQLAGVASKTQKIQAEQGILTGKVQLLPIQRWFFAQKQPEPHHWNQSFLLASKEKINLLDLAAIIDSLRKHHDVLRLRFMQEESGTQAWISDTDHQLPLTCIDLSLVAKDQQAAAIETAASELQASLNLSQGPLFRVALFDLGQDQDQRLLWVIHHLAIDGVSWRVLLEDFHLAFGQLEQNRAIKLPFKTTSYRQWSSGIQEYAKSPELLAESDFWLNIRHQPIATIPRDFADGENTAASEAEISVSLSAAETQSLLQQAPSAYRTQINDLLLTALLLTFSQWTTASSLLIDLEGHGREEILEDVDLSRTVGWFTTLFPVHLQLDQDSDLGTTIKSVKEQLRAIPDRGIGYGLLRYGSQNQEIAKLLSTIEAEVAFNYLGQFNQVLPESSLFSLAPEGSGSEHSLNGTRTHLLEINSEVYQGNLQISWSFSKNLHRRTTIETLAQNYIQTLRSLIAHCQSPEAGGFTPSDFADFQQSQWSQTDLDAISEAIGDI
ncbi:MAG: condensation domain-containing protein, partial [Cyanobacteria bacterium P01_C01_bin.72]